MRRWTSNLETARPVLVLVSVAALIASSLTVAIYNEGQYEARVRQTAQVEAHVLADIVTAALSFGDKTALQEYVSAERDNAELDAVGVYDTGGHLVAGFTRSSLPNTLPSARLVSAAPGRVVVTSPVAESGQTLGTVYLRTNAEPLLRRMARYVAPGLLVLMASLMFLIMTLDAQTLDRTNRDLEGQIVERERVEAALRQSQKMEATGRLTGGIAHDFNNMLAVIMGSLDLMARRFSGADPKLLHLANEAMEAAKRASALTQRLLAFSRLQPLNPTSVDVSKAVNDTTILLRRSLGETVAVETILAGGLWRAHIDLPQLELAIVNLAINSRDAMPNGGKLTIETGNAYLDQTYADEQQDVTPGQYVMVAISDTGTGIAPEYLGQVFEPFFTTKPTGQGTGLGLSQVHGFIKQSGGHMRIFSEVGVGTTVKLYLPRSLTEAQQPVDGAARSPKSSHRDLTVLLVEDEDGVREFAAEALSELGFDVVPAEGPEVALRLLDAHPEIEMLLTDVVMPGMSGETLADEALRRRPSLRVVFMTGYARDAIVHNGVVDPGVYLLNKPFTVAQLGAKLEAVLSEARVA